MDTSNDNEELLKQIKHLAAERESLLSQINEYGYIIDIRDEQIELLEKQNAEATELRSVADNQLNELQSLQNHIGRLQQQAEGATNREVNLEFLVAESVSVEQQLADLQEQYTYLQVQLSDMQLQLNEIQNRNLLLQQQNSRVAELESLLEDARLEIEALKAQAAFKE